MNNNNSSKLEIIQAQLHGEFINNWYVFSGNDRFGAKAESSRLLGTILTATVMKNGQFVTGFKVTTEREGKLFATKAAAAKAIARKVA